MGVIDEVKSSDSNKDSAQLPINPSLSTSKDDSAEISVPQMFITSADEVNQEIELAVKQEQNVVIVEEKPSLTTIREEYEEEKEKEIGGERKDVSSAQQRPLVISTLSELSRVAVDQSSRDHEIQQPRTESPPLSAIQRPLVLEQVPPQPPPSVSSGVQETQQESLHDHISCTSASTVERPLVVDGSCVPYDSYEHGTLAHLETEINGDIREQSSSGPTTCPVLSAREPKEIEEEIPPAVESPDSPSKSKGFFTKADGTSIFSLPKFSIGSSKEHSEVTKEKKDAAHVQATSDEVHVESEKPLSTDKSAEDQDGKTPFSLPKFSFGLSKEPKSKEQKDSSTHSQGSSPEIHPDSTVSADGKEHSKEGSKVTFSLPKFSFSSSRDKELSKEQQDSSLNQSGEGYQSPTIVSDLGSSADVKESKHGFHLPKFGFSSTKESKDVSKDQYDTSPSQSVESRPSSTDITDVEKEGSKHGFHLPKFGFISTKESKNVLKEQNDASPSQSVESRPSSTDVTDLEKEGSKHGFHLPKFSFGSSKESKEMLPKEQPDSSLNQVAGSAGASGGENYSAESTKEGTKHGFSLPKFSFGPSKESKEISKQDKDGSASHSTSVEKSPISIEVTGAEAGDVKEDGKHSFQFPKFSFGSSKEQKSTSPVPLSESPVDSSKVVISDSKHTPESAKPMFSLPKFSFGSTKDHKEDTKETRDTSHPQSPFPEDHHAFPTEASLSETGVKNVAKEDSKHSFSFPKFSMGSPKTSTKEPTKESKDAGEIPEFIVEDFSSAGSSKVDTTKDSGKHSFSFPKFGFGSSKEDEATKELKDSSKVAKSEAEVKPTTEESKHTFSFPKFGMSSSKETTKHPKDATQTEVSAVKDHPATTESADTPSSTKPFSFPKITFGSLKEHKETSKEQKEVQSSSEGCPEGPQLKATDVGYSVQKPIETKKTAPLASEERDPFKSKTTKQVPERASSFKATKELKEAEKGPKTEESPSSLYETCCMRLAGMICNKAMEIVSEHTSKRGPPKKPPKPSAEAVARARAAIVAKRVQEYEKNKTFGDDIPFGYNGIRFADDDTESSTDYKDEDNAAYIMEYDCTAIVRKMKSDNIIQTFSCPSISSYYTADEMTLKDGNFSDNTLESISLESEESLVYKPALSSLDEDLTISPTMDRVSSSKADSVKKPVEKQKSSPASFFFFSRSKTKAPPKEVSTPTVLKRVPPPVPPKPQHWPRSESQVKIEVPEPMKPEVQKCVDSLSLSPRPVLRNLPATGGIKKRPLTIAGIKETEFPSYGRSTRAEEPQKKTVLTTVVKNQSLEKVPVISASTTALDRSLVPPSKTSDIQSVSMASLTRKPAPQRPPPPVKSVSAINIPAAAKPAKKSKAAAVPREKPPLKPRPHISPPRPPPPKVKPVISPPPRPPPPIGVNKISVSSPDIRQHFDSTEITQISEKPLEVSIQEEAVCDKVEIRDISQPIPLQADISSPPDQVTDDQQLESSQKIGVDQTQREVLNQNVINTVDISSTVQLVDSMSNKETVETKEQLISDTQSIPDKLPALTENLNQNVEVSQTDVAPTPAARGLKKPRPPPRTRRIRSRTVEIVSVVWKPEERLRRSQSLSDVDVKKKTEGMDDKKTEGTDVQNSDEKPELKSLYTSVNKEPAKGKDERLDVDLQNIRKSPSPESISSRPLPAPPPPPRTKHYSDSPKPKLDAMLSSKSVSPELPSKSVSPEMPESCVKQEEEKVSIKPPVRKKKEEKLRSRSLENKDKETKKSPTRNGNASTSLDRANSFTSGVPKKPKRKQKVLPHEYHYDENANIAESIPPESPLRSRGHHSVGSHSDLISSSNSKSFIREQRSSSEKLVKRRSPSLDGSHKKSHSSWYDESDVSGDLGDVDTLPGSLKTSTERLNYEVKNSDAESGNMNRLLRAKQDSPKKPRETSKFYVNLDASETEEIPVSPEEPVPRVSHSTVDKETSPLPLECSEKSVQTSLETLSQGRASRSEQSDDTDELLDLAQTLQDELKTILNRHKKQGPEGESDCDTSGSQNQLDVPGASFAKAGPTPKRKDRKPLHAPRAASDLWQVSSSDESDESAEDQMKNHPPETLIERKKKKVFYIAQEIMTSEEVFVDSLKLLNIDFRNWIDEANKQKGSYVIPNEIMNQILNHLPQLQHLNENLLMELKDRINNWEDVGKIADVIVKMGPFLKLYSWYIQDFESMVGLLDDAKKKYPIFSQVVKEFENTPRCNRLALNHYMLKPVQRIPQYRLLLQEYLHHLPKDSPDYNDTLTALQIVSEVANHANESMKQGDNFQKLISIQNSIFGHKEIIKPGRAFVKEGELMKLSRKGMQPRWFVLLSDVLLYLTPVQQGLYRVNHELTLTGMKVAIPIQQDYQNEFSIISVTRSFTLAAKSPEERQEWIVALTKAIEENASKRSTFTNVRLQQKSEGGFDEDDDESFVLGRKAPVWIPDARVTMCQLCTSEFTVTFRRHHCRACGKVVCSVCSSNRTALHYLGNRNARVCDECYVRIEQGSGGGYTESGETDSDNQQIAVKAHLRTDSRHGRKPKRQLPSVLKEVCANDQGSSISGYLLKKSGKSWKRDWFVVKDKVLYEYKASEDVAALRSLPLLGYQIETFSEPYEGIDSTLLFQLTHPGQPPVVFHADNTVAAERWISALKEATVLE